MVEQENFNKFLKLTNKVAQNYLENYKNRHIKLLKQKIKDLLTDPIWNDKLIFQLKQQFGELNLTKEEYDSLWNEMDKIFENVYDEFKNDKRYLFDAKIREYEKRLIDFFVRVGKLKRQKSTLATIIGCLLIHKQYGLTQAQIKELTGLSKGAISTNLNMLSGTPLIKKELIKGTKQFSYTFGGDFSALATGTTFYKLETNNKAKNFVQAKANELEKYKNKKGYKILSQRINEIHNYLEIHKGLINYIKTSDFIKGIEKQVS